MIWALHTTALARIRLYQYIKELSKYGKVLYCDTDSIFLLADKGKNYPVSDKLGDMKLQGKYRYIEIKSNKFYGYGDTGLLLYKKIKGVPYANMEEFFSKGETTYRKPLRLKEGLRRNMPINLWIDYTKKIRHNYDKGIITDTGDIEPIYINNS
jgi:DNA polymerase elongation subunit (family B)